MLLDRLEGVTVTSNSDGKERKEFRLFDYVFPRIEIVPVDFEGFGPGSVWYVNLSLGGVLAGGADGGVLSLPGSFCAQSQSFVLRDLLSVRIRRTLSITWLRNASDQGLGRRPDLFFSRFLQAASIPVGVEFQITFLGEELEGGGENQEVTIGFQIRIGTLHLQGCFDHGSQVFHGCFDVVGTAIRD